MLLGLFSGMMVDVLAAMPRPLVIAIAGLGLLSPLMSALPAMTREPPHLEAAVIAFLVTASASARFTSARLSGALPRASLFTW